MVDSNLRDLRKYQLEEFFDRISCFNFYMFSPETQCKCRSIPIVVLNFRTIEHIHKKTRESHFWPSFHLPNTKDVFHQSSIDNGGGVTMGHFGGRLENRHSWRVLFLIGNRAQKLRSIYGVFPVEGKVDGRLEIWRGGVRTDCNGESFGGQVYSRVRKSFIITRLPLLRLRSCMFDFCFFFV